jgi:hypothetical protein
VKVLVAVCSSEVQNVGAIRSAYFIKQQTGDKFVDHWVSRGDVTRERFVKTFLEMDYYGPEDAILLLDGDQRHPEDLLEKLRAHDLDMVCAHYYRRSTDPVQSLCYAIGDGRWPYLPMVHPPKEGLHEIAVTGFGCVLIKKRVLQAVQDTLPKGMSPVAIGPLPDVYGDYSNWGPDFRFFHKARELGYKLWLDASVESLHAVTVWLGHKSAEALAEPVNWADAAHGLLISRLELYGIDPERLHMSLEAFRQRRIILGQRLEGLMQEALEAGKRGDTHMHEQLSVAVYQVQGKVMEMDAWIEWAEKYPAIERPDQLPTTENTPAHETFLSEAGDNEAASLEERQGVYREQAIELVDMLPDVTDERQGME